MKRLTLLLLSIGVLNTPVYAATAPGLNLELSGPISQTLYVCLDNMDGCVSVKAFNHGQKLPMSTTAIHNLYLVDMANLRMYPQNLPQTCTEDFTQGQSVNMTGKVTKAANDAVYIDHLQCNVKHG